MINLTKNSKINLSKDIASHPNLTKFTLGLGWDITNGKDIDLDSHAIVLDDNNCRISHTYFFNQKNSGVRLSGDNLTGKGDGVDEYMYVDIEKLPLNAAKVEFYINIFSDDARFDKIDNAFVCGFTGNDERNPLFKYNIPKYDSSIRFIKACEIVKTNDGWDFVTCEQGYTGMINSHVNSFSKVKAERNPNNKGLISRIFGK